MSDEIAQDQFQGKYCNKLERLQVQEDLVKDMDEIMGKRCLFLEQGCAIQISAVFYMVATSTCVYQAFGETKKPHF